MVLFQPAVQELDGGSEMARPTTGTVAQWCCESALPPRRPLFSDHGSLGRCARVEARGDRMGRKDVSM